MPYPSSCPERGCVDLIYFSHTHTFSAVPATSLLVSVLNRSSASGRATPVGAVRVRTRPRTGGAGRGSPREMASLPLTWFDWCIPSPRSPHTPKKTHQLSNHVEGSRRARRGEPISRATGTIARLCKVLAALAPLALSLFACINCGSTTTTILIKDLWYRQTCAAGRNTAGQLSPFIEQPQWAKIVELWQWAPPLLNTTKVLFV